VLQRRGGSFYCVAERQLQRFNMLYLTDAGSNCAQAFSHSFGSKLAIHGRYTECRFLCILYRYLRGITVRPVPCNYNVIQSVVALSRRRRGFKSRRGRQLNTLQEKSLLSV